MKKLLTNNPTENPGFDSTLGLNITPKNNTKEGLLRKTKPRLTVGVGAVACGGCILEVLLYTRCWARWFTWLTLPKSHSDPMRGVVVYAHFTDDNSEAQRG